MKGFVLASAFALFQAISAVAPGQAAPGTPVAGCSTSYDGTFSIGIANVSSSATKLKRQAITLTMTLQDGILTDSEGRTGYIASNRQFQFDLFNGQAGTIYNSGFSVCPNGTLALESPVWWGCLSGEFRNLYDKTQGDQCIPLYLLATPVSGTGPIPDATTVTSGGGSNNGGSGNHSGSSSSNDHDDSTTVVATRTRDTHTPNATAHATTKTANTLISTSKVPHHTIVVAPKNSSTTRTGGGSGPTGTGIGVGGNGGSGGNGGNGGPSQSSPAPSDGGNGAPSLASNSFLTAVAALAYALFI